jgi:aryl-alcohol dehydrogenase-like predicted oxidoreductase
LSIAPLGLGGFPFGEVNRAAGWDPFTVEGRQTAIATIRRALELGINYLDTAPGYSDGNSESIFGEALVGRRSDVALATKCPWKTDAATVSRSVSASLGRLRTDWLDVVQAPRWDVRGLLALKFVLSDSRVDVANVGMRWPAEVERNVGLVESFEPPFDVAELPRLTAGICGADDAETRGETCSSHF